MFKLNLHQVIFALSIIITASIPNSALTASNIQMVVAEQQGSLPPPPVKDCSLYDKDGRKIYVPCPDTRPPPLVDTTKTKSFLSNDDGITNELLQTSPSSSITTNSIPSTRIMEIQ